MPQYVYPFTYWWTLGWCPLLSITNKAAMNSQVQVLNGCMNFSQVNTEVWNG